jgi:hypothetical protein
MTMFARMTFTPPSEQSIPIINAENLSKARVERLFVNNKYQLRELLNSSLSFKGKIDDFTEIKVAKVCSAALAVVKAQHMLQKAEKACTDSKEEPDLFSLFCDFEKQNIEEWIKERIRLKKKLGEIEKETGLKVFIADSV